MVYRDQHMEQVDRAQSKVLDVEMKAMAEVSSANREEYVHAERIKKESAELADQLQASAQAYVRTTIRHTTSLLENEVYRCEIKPHKTL